VVQLQELPRGANELEDWLWDYMVGRITQPMVERVARNLGHVLRGKFTTDLGEEIAKNIQEMSAKEFSDWVVAKS